MADGYYSEEEAQEILRLATRKATSEGGMSRDRLIEAAAEMGIDPADVLAAEKELRSKHEKVELREQYLVATRRKFFGSTTSLVGTSITLFGINYLTSGFHGIWSMWAIWPCGFMALGALKEGWEFLISRTPMGEEEFENWIARQRRKELFVQGQLSDPASPTTMQAAREICAEHGPDHRDHAIDAMHHQLGLRRRDAKTLVKVIYGERSPEVLASLAPVNPQSFIDIARAARDYHGDAKLSAIATVREKTGLGLAEAKALVDNVYREQSSVRQTPPNPPVSTYEAARQALAEAGPEHKLVAAHLLQQRTGIGIQEATDAIEAVVELSH